MLRWTVADSTAGRGCGCGLFCPATGSYQSSTRNCRRRSWSRPNDRCKQWPYIKHALIQNHDFFPTRMRRLPILSLSPFRSHIPPLTSHLRFPPVPTSAKTHETAAVSSQQEPEPLPEGEPFPGVVVHRSERSAHAHPSKAQARDQRGGGGSGSGGSGGSGRVRRRPKNRRQRRQRRQRRRRRVSSGGIRCRRWESGRHHSRRICAAWGQVSECVESWSRVGAGTFWNRARGACFV